MAAAKKASVESEEPEESKMDELISLMSELLDAVRDQTEAVQDAKGMGTEDLEGSIQEIVDLLQGIGDSLSILVGTVDDEYGSGVIRTLPVEEHEDE